MKILEKLFTFGMFIFLIIVTVVGGVLGIIKLWGSNDHLFFKIIFSFAILFIGAFMTYNLLEIIKSYKQLAKFDDINEAIPIKDGEENDIEPLRVMRYNLDKIKSYYDWSLLLSVLSFIFAFGMSIGGIFLIWNIVFSSSNDKKVDIIGIAGGVASEFVAATAMVAFRLSLKHLKRYHSSLHEDQRVMTSLSIIDKISNDKDRDEMYKKVIDYEMQLSLKEVTAESKKEKNDN
jgi:hypothetical protein